MKFLNYFNKKRGKIFSIILLIIAIVYDISPADIIPDVLPLFGLCDDIAVTLIVIINTYLKWRKKY